MLENICDRQGRKSDIAKKMNCYKVFLETGSNRESTLIFYRNNGFAIDEKHLSEELSCDGFEFIIEFHMYESGYVDAEEQKRLLKKLNLCILVVHCDKMVGEYISIGGAENIAEAIWTGRICPRCR